MSRWMRVAATAAFVAMLAGCSSTPGELTPVPTMSPTPGATPSPTPDPLAQPVGEPVVVAEGLTTPWSVARLASGSSLISERDTAQVKELTASGEVRVVGTVEGVQPGGEGGLLGLAVSPAVSASTAASTGSANEATEAGEAGEATDGTWLYAYLTSASDNRIVRYELAGKPGAYSLGAREDVLTGIAKAGNHNGGRLEFGPDGMLYATTGDASIRTAAQDPASLNGKILRMSPTGDVPLDNPTAGSLVYSLGHRNPQGLTWDASGQLWAAEFGQDTWDELNVISPGGNYGWPVVEGVASDPAFINPVYQWATDDASPSGLAFTRGSFYLAALKGQRLWSVTTSDGAVATPYLEGEFGRLRDAVPGPDGSLWVLTSNTDGRGNPQSGDDKLLQVALETVAPG